MNRSPMLDRVERDIRRRELCRILFDTIGFVTLVGGTIYLFWILT